MITRVLAGVIALAVAGALGWVVFSRLPDGFGGREAANAASTESTPSVDVVTIKAVMEHPDSYSGAVRLEGVVAQVDTDRGLFMIMSREDWLACGESDCCSPLMLPVHGAGDPPPTETVVRVEGRIGQVDGKYLLELEAMQRLDG